MIDTCLKCHVSVYISSGYNSVSIVCHHSAARFQTVIIYIPHHIIVKHSLIYHLAGTVIDDPSAVESKHISAKSVKLYGVCYLPYSRQWTSRCYRNDMPLLLCLYYFLQRCRSNILLSICQRSVNIKCQ